MQSAPLQVFAGDGFIAVDRRVDPADVVGYDLDRAERWRHPIAAGAHVVLVDDGLVEIADHLTTSTTVTFLAGDPGG